MKARFYERYRYPLLAVFVCLAPLVVLGAAKAMRTNANDVRTWLPQGLPETIEYARFGRYFGTEEFVVVSWEGCTVDDPRLQVLAERLKPSAGGSERDSGSSLVEGVLTTPEAIKELMSPPINLTRDEAIARLRGFAIGPDGRQSCAVVRPSEHGKHDPQSLLKTIYNTAEECGVPRNAVRTGGPLVTSVSVDEAANASLNVLGLLSVATAVVFSWICFRSLRLTILVVVVGVFAAAAALATVWFSGGEMNAVLVTMPPLVYVSTMSGAIHWANYYRDAVADHGTAGAIEKTVAHARLPLALATGTTALGLLSLCGSDLLPIRQFGLYSAIGVLASLVWLLVVLPLGCALWLPLSASEKPRTAPSTFTRANWWSWGRFITDRPGRVAVTVLALAVSCGLGLSRVRTSVTAEEFFSDDAAYPKNAHWLEDHMGGIVPMELIVRIAPECQLNMLERLKLIESVQQSVATLDGVGTSVSAVTFCPRLPAAGDGQWSLKRSVLNRRLEHHRDRLVSMGFLATANDTEVWRISLRTNSFRGVDRRHVMDAVKRRVDQVLKAQGDRDGISASLTGMVPLIERAQQSLLEGLIIGLATDLALIVVAIVVLIRHWSVGLVLLLTSVVPVLTVLGLMGWMGIVLDIGSVLAPSVALGVTVDDVLHFVLWFRRGLAQGLDRQQSLRIAYGNCARAMLQSWGVIGLGLSVFAWSDFTPTRRFGLLMISLLSVGLVVNLFLLPALLAGPLGRALARGIKTTKATGKLQSGASSEAKRPTIVANSEFSPCALCCERSLVGI
ncbi:MAG: MMPL family transporter [Pirellulales bacterium]|nr:MMPL family transporter [Pirellulales bacterium]